MENQSAIADVERVEETPAAEQQKPVEVKPEAKPAEVTTELAKPEAELAKPEETKPVWADDWREQASGGDEAKLKLAKRYGSPAGILKALQETQAKLNSVSIKPPKPDPSDEKAMAEWRKAEGIPETAEGYVFSDAIKAQMTDADKPLMSSFTDYAHKAGAPQSAVDLAAGWYFGAMEKMEADRKAKDAQDAEALETTLRQDWGREYKANYELGRRYLSSVPGVGQEWANAVLPDGRLLGNVPEFVQWASDQGRTEFGDATFASGDSEARHASRKAEIEKIRDTDFDRYEREGLDKEYRGIIEKDLKRAKR